jgi:hypothetical protein
LLGDSLIAPRRLVGDLQLHARLAFRDVRWILRDLASTDGTLVKGTKVGRCELRRATSW